MLDIAARCLARELTTGVPGGVRGAWGGPLEKTINRKRKLTSKYLQHVAENAEDAVESLVFLGSSTSGRMSLPADTGHKLSHETEVNDKRTGQ